MENKIWFTSDTHFSHDKEFLYGDRGFNNPDDMNAEIVKRWNKLVKPEDEVYHLGDVILSDIEKGMEIFKQLNGNFHIIRGNHDTDKKVEEYKKLDNVISIDYATEIKYHKWRFFLCHYPAITRTLDDKPNKQGIINLHGHTHQKVNFKDDNNPYVYHVGMDSHYLRPISIEEIILDITNKKQELKEKGDKINENI